MTSTGTLTETELKQIEACVDKTSAGPWSMTWNTRFGPAIWSHGEILVRCEAGLEHSIVSESDPVPQWRKDMDFIRAAREDIPALCRSLRAAWAEIERQRAVHDQGVRRLREMEADRDRERTRANLERDVKEEAQANLPALRAQLAQVEQERKRLLRGEFTDEELQGFCHNLSEEDRQAFFTGCTKYQERLFGTSAVAELTKPEDSK